MKEEEVMTVEPDWRGSYNQPIECSDGRHPVEAHHHGQRRAEGWYNCNYMAPVLCTSAFYRVGASGGPRPQ